MNADNVSNVPNGGVIDLRICGSCGAANDAGRAKCWLCGVQGDFTTNEVNPYQPPANKPPIVSYGAPNAMTNVQRSIDNVVFYGVSTVFVLALIGFLAGGETGLAIGLVVFAVPGILAFLYTRYRQHHSVAGAFWSSKTVALLAGAAASIISAALLVVGAIILLFALCLSEMSK